MLTLKEKIDLLEGRISRANRHWSFLFSINLAVVGWALSKGDTFNEINVSLFIVILFLTYIFIFLAILRVQSEMAYLEKDIINEINESEQDSYYIRYLGKTRFQNLKMITWPVYWFGNIAVIVFLLCK